SPSTRATTVAYAVTGGTATQGMDYTLPDGMLTFNPGETSKDLPLAILDGPRNEPDETIQVSLPAPSANASLGSRMCHTYTSLADDSPPSVSFVTRGASGLESEVGELQVALSAPSGQTVVVHYGVTGGTAAGNGVDYTVASGTLTFAPGQT